MNIDVKGEINGFYWWDFFSMMNSFWVVLKKKMKTLVIFEKVSQVAILKVEH